MSQQFNGRPLLDIWPDHRRLTHGQLDDFNLKRVSAASSTPWKPTTRIKRRFTLPFLFGTKTEWRAFRDFFEDRRGLEAGFWVPFWVTDYESYQQDVGTALIKVKDINLAEAFEADGQFAYLALIDPTTIEPLEISNITSLPNGDEQFNVTPAIAHDFDLTHSQCCPLLYCRLADPELTYTWITDQVCRCELELVELPCEYAESHEATRPVYLYEFTRGGLTWNLTNWPEAITTEDETTWQPDNITHGRIRSGVEFLSEPLDLTVGTDTDEHPLRYYMRRRNMEITSLAIFESDADELELDRDEPIYQGRITSVTYDEAGIIKADCSSILRISEQQVPRQQVQRTCNHRLFDANCGVLEATYETPGTLIDVTDDYVEAAEFGAEATARDDDDWFAMGKVRVGTEVRMIVGADGDRLYLDEPFAHAEGGQAAVALPGCDKRIGTCQNKFNNVLRTIQFPYLPSRNPQFEALATPKPSGGKKS